MVGVAGAAEEDMLNVITLNNPSWMVIKIDEYARSGR